VSTEETWEFHPETIEEEAARLAAELPLRCSHCGEKETDDGWGWLHVEVSPIGGFSWCGAPDTSDDFLDGPLTFCSLDCTGMFFVKRAHEQGPGGIG
jgi:hypothetical protein